MSIFALFSLSTAIKKIPKLLPNTRKLYCYFPLTLALKIHSENIILLELYILKNYSHCKHMYFNKSNTNKHHSPTHLIQYSGKT